MTPELFYRYEESKTLNNPVILKVFKVIKETPCGYWIKLFYRGNDKKWVSKTTKKRYAYPTKQEALTSFKARKRRQIEILNSQLIRAKSALRWADPEGVYQERRVKRWASLD